MGLCDRVHPGQSVVTRCVASQTQDRANRCVLQGYWDVEARAMNRTKPKIRAKVEWTIEHILRWIHEGPVSWVRQAYLRVELMNLCLVCCRP
jgi:hypothetical protein